ncbi:MAG: divalent cation transporter [Pseudomonadota bacterium]
MSEIAAILLFTIVAGACIPLGGFVASFEHIHARWLEQELRHFLIAVGGGILVGAVAVVLVPAGVASMQGSLWAIPIVLAGGLAFFVIERALGLRRREAPQVTGMLLDYIPEATALGGLVALGSGQAALLALLIGLQNLPEGFNAFRELHALGVRSARRTLAIMASLVAIGPVAGLAGYFLLAGFPAALGAIMLFASGGILYLIFQDIAPQSRLNRHWAPPLGAVVGFSVALFGDMLVRGG